MPAYGYGACAEAQGFCECGLTQTLFVPQLCDSFSHDISFLVFVHFLQVTTGCLQKLSKDVGSVLVRRYS